MSKRARPTEASSTSREIAMPDNRGEEAFTFMPEHGFSMFLARRCKTIHFVRHAEGTHNEANRKFGSDLPTVYSTEGAWDHLDARLTPAGVSQCLDARTKLLSGVTPELVVVSPFTRTLQTAHIMFAGNNLPFLVHDVCRERFGMYTCDKRRPKKEIVADMAPLFAHTNDLIDFDSFAFQEEDDILWTEEREPDEDCSARGILLLKWLATRPETEIAVVTHSSFLRHLFGKFGGMLEAKDQERLQRKTGNAEVRSVSLALHKGFYPKGHWVGDTDIFIPDHQSFRRGRWAVQDSTLRSLHAVIKPNVSK